MSQRKLILAQREAFVEGAKAKHEFAKAGEEMWLTYWRNEAARRYPLTVTEPRVAFSRKHDNKEYRVIDGKLESRSNKPGTHGNWNMCIAIMMADYPVVADLFAN